MIPQTLSPSVTTRHPTCNFSIRSMAANTVTFWSVVWTLGPFALRISLTQAVMALSERSVERCDKGVNGGDDVRRPVLPPVS